MTVKRETLAWCAGVLDSSGSISAHGRTVRWQVHSGDAMLLDRLAAVLGGTVVGPYENKFADGMKRRPRYVWHVDGRHAVAGVLRRLRPWLSPAKIEAAESRLALTERTPA